MRVSSTASLTATQRNGCTEKSVGDPLTPTDFFHYTCLSDACQEEKEVDRETENTDRNNPNSKSDHQMIPPPPTKRLKSNPSAFYGHSGRRLNPSLIGSEKLPEISGEFLGRRKESKVPFRNGKFLRRGVGKSSKVEVRREGCFRITRSPDRPYPPTLPPRSAWKEIPYSSKSWTVKQGRSADHGRTGPATRSKASGPAISPAISQP